MFSEIDNVYTTLLIHSGLNPRKRSYRPRKNNNMFWKANYSVVYNSENLERIKCLPIDTYPFQIGYLYFHVILSGN